jgi:NADPH2:quinone reductase
MNMRAVVVSRLGGPEVLELSEAPRPEPGPGQVLVRVHRAGVNFTDTERRR